MAESPDLESGAHTRRPSVRGMLGRLAWFALVLLVADFVLWYGVTRGPSEGANAECAYCVGLTASGPLAMIGNTNDVLEVAGLCTVLILGVVFAVIGRRFIVLRLLGYFSMLVWFFFGFAVAGCRVT